MSENKPTHQPRMSVRTLAICAMLVALSVVLARLIIPMPNAFTRFSIESVPVFIAGALFGPIAGAMVGFASDFVGCLFSGYGYNPLFCVPPILYGVVAGLFRMYLAAQEKPSLVRIGISYLPAIVAGSILWQSFALAYVYNSKGSFQASLVYFLSTRSVQFAVTWVIDAVVVFLLFRSGLFNRVNLWPPVKK